MSVQMHEDNLESCAGCIFLDTSLFPEPFWGDCDARKKSYGIVDRAPNARAPWGKCGPERKNWMAKQLK